MTLSIKQSIRITSTKDESKKYGILSRLSNSEKSNFLNSLVSIIIPTRNRAHLIGQTLESVIAQTYLNWECIVVNDDSEDYTDELMEFYSLKDKRIIYYRRPENKLRGANSCRNFGFKQSRGRFVNWLDSDDVLMPGKLEVQVKALEQKDEYVIATSTWNFFSGEKSIIPQKKFPVFQSYEAVDEFLNDLGVSGGFLPPHSYLMSRKMVEDAGNWMENLTINQDGEFLSRIFIRASEVVYCGDAQVLYRLHEGENISFLNNETKARHAIYSWNLIENNFRIRFGKAGKLVSVSKKYLYSRLEKEYPEVILEHKEFFKDQIPKRNYYFSKALKKLILKR